MERHIQCAKLTSPSKKAWWFHCCCSSASSLPVLQPSRSAREGAGGQTSSLEEFVLFARPKTRKLTQGQSASIPYWEIAEDFWKHNRPVETCFMILFFILKVIKLQIIFQDKKIKEKNCKPWHAGITLSVLLSPPAGKHPHICVHTCLVYTHAYVC